MAGQFPAAMTKRIWIALLVWGMVQTVALAQIEPSARELPRWRGFNLLEMFMKSSSPGPFREDDFRLISEWGFNFVRLPMDYRIWIQNGDWTRFNETALRWVDQAVEYGRQYGVHVCLNFHRAPGYTVASPPEPTSLWTDPVTQQVCAMHWAHFARRYKGIPNSQLSFNLLNEPADIDPNVHARVVSLLVEAIRAEDPNRLIIADGINYAVTPSWNLIPLGVAQATRGYQPFTLTHYKASWVAGSDQWAEPMWPEPLGFSGYLYGPTKSSSSPRRSSRRTCRNRSRSASAWEPCRTRPGSRSAWMEGGEPGSSGHQDFKPGPGEGPWKRSCTCPSGTPIKTSTTRSSSFPSRRAGGRSAWRTRSATG